MMREVALPFEPIAELDFELHAGDNAHILPQIESCSIQLVVTSPPYNIGKEYEKKQDINQYILEQRAVLRECERVLREGGSLCWQVGNHVTQGEVLPLDIVIYPIIRDLGLKLRNRIIWHYGHGLHCNKRLSGRYETILWFTKGDEYIFNLDDIRIPSKYPRKKHYRGPKKGQLSGNPKGKNPSDIWNIPNVKHNHCEKTDHPCQFPIELVERLVLALTNLGDTVLDPYAGVGSSVVAAAKHRRKGIGIEVREDYLAIAHDRLAQLAAGTLRMRPMNKPIYEPPNGNGHED